MLLKYITSPLTNIPKLKKKNLSMVYNKRWAIVPKNKVKYTHFINVLYYIIKLQKPIKY